MDSGKQQNPDETKIQKLLTEFGFTCSAAGMGGAGADIKATFPDSNKGILVEVKGNDVKWMSKDNKIKSGNTPLKQLSHKLPHPLSVEDAFVTLVSDLRLFTTGLDVNDALIWYHIKPEGEHFSKETGATTLREIISLFDELAQYNEIQLLRTFLGETDSIPLMSVFSNHLEDLIGLFCELPMTLQKASAMDNYPDNLPTKINEGDEILLLPVGDFNPFKNNEKYFKKFVLEFFLSKSQLHSIE